MITSSVKNKQAGSHNTEPGKHILNDCSV